jgi:hypothetical protein
MVGIRVTKECRAVPSLSAAPVKLEGVVMSRPNSGGFVLGFAAEIAIVVAVVSWLPRIDLSGGRAEATAVTPSKPEPLRETAFAEPRLSALNWESRADRPTPLPRAEPRVLRDPPPLLAVDPARPAYVERRLDQASQGLVNGLGSYVARSAENLLPQPSPASGLQAHAPLSPPAYQPAAAPAPFAAGSFPTQPAQTPQPRPWVKY